MVRVPRDSYVTRTGSSDAGWDLDLELIELILPSILSYSYRNLINQPARQATSKPHSVNHPTTPAFHHTKSQGTELSSTATPGLYPPTRPPMAQYYPQSSTPYNPQSQNLNFYQSSYPAPVSGHSTPSQAQYPYSNTHAQNPYGQPQNAYGGSSGSGFGGFGVGGGGGAGGGVSGRMGEQGGLRTGWLAAFGTEGYEGEPPLLEELGVNFGHIKGKVTYTLLPPPPVLP